MRVEASLVAEESDCRETMKKHGVLFFLSDHVIVEP